MPSDRWSGGTSGRAPARKDSAPPPPSSLGSWGWAGGAVAIVGGALLVRSLLRGTAPSANSNYVMYRNASAAAARAVPDKPPAWKTPAPEWQPEAGSMGAGGRRAGTSSHSSYSHPPPHAQQHTQQSWQGTGAGSTHFNHQRQSQYEEEQRQQRQAEEQRQRAEAERLQREREAEYDAAFGNTTDSAGRWAHHKSDFAKYEAFLAAERAHNAHRAAAAAETVFGEFMSSLGTQERSFQLGREQARADYVQSKFMHLKRGRKILRYESWAGTRASEADDADGDFDDSEAARAGRDANEAEGKSQRAFSAIQRQLATQPRFVLARQLLFAPASSAAASSSSSSSPDSAAPFSPLASSAFGGGGAPLGPLSVDAVRTAYFQRAKLCHPDISGSGNREQFQRLTDAYDLLIETLEPIEKQAMQQRRKRREQQQAQQQAQQQQQAQSAPPPDN